MIGRDAGKYRRLELSVDPVDYRTLQQAAALTQSDLSSYVIQAARDAGTSLIAGPGRLQLSKRDSIRVIELLENPPEPNERMIAAARGLPSGT